MSLTSLQTEIHCGLKVIFICMCIAIVINNKNLYFTGDKSTIVHLQGWRTGGTCLQMEVATSSAPPQQSVAQRRERSARSTETLRPPHQCVWEKTISVTFPARCLVSSMWIFLPCISASSSFLCLLWTAGWDPARWQKPQTTGLPVPRRRCPSLNMWIIHLSTTAFSSCLCLR